MNLDEIKPLKDRSQELSVTTQATSTIESTNGISKTSILSSHDSNGKIKSHTDYNNSNNEENKDENINKEPPLPLPTTTNSKSKFILFSLLLQFLGSGNTICMRYLLVKARETSSRRIEWYELLSSTRLCSVVLLILWTMIQNSCYCCVSSSISSSSQINASSSRIHKALNTSKHKKLISCLIFGSLATCRSAFNFLASKNTKAYNIVLIQNASPMIVTFMDYYFLGTKSIPKTLVPCIIFTMVGGSIIAYAQAQPFSTTHVDDDHSVISSTTISKNNMNDLVGCSLAFFAVLMSALCRLMMKLTHSILSPTEMAFSGHCFNVVVPLLYSLTTPTTTSSWNILLNLSIQSYLAWSFIAIFICTFSSPMQIYLNRVLGPSLFSSMSGVRVLGSVSLSYIVLKEPIMNELEWIGVGITLMTMTFYVYSLHHFESISKKFPKERTFTKLEKKHSSGEARQKEEHYIISNKSLEHASIDFRKVNTYGSVTS